MTESSPCRRLSVVVIVRDAAEPLRLTLASVRDIADEIVVVDTGSTDRSKDVAKEFGSKFFEFPWADDFSAARNSAASQAEGDWLLWLDAGETLSNQDARQLKDFILAQPADNQAYFLAIRLPPADPSSSAEQIARVRLMPRAAQIQFSGRVSESPLESMRARGITPAGLPYVIHRGERELDLRLKKQRAQRNLRIAEANLRECGDQARLWNCLGDALQTLGDNGRAVDCFRRALTLAQRSSPEMLESYYGILTSLGATESERQEQYALCVQALEVFPTDAQLLCALGGYLQARNNLQLAGQAYLTAFKFGQVNPLVWHVTEIRDVAAVCHSLTLQLRNEPDSAVQFLEAALAENPESLRMRRRLIDIFIQQSDRDAALAHVSALPKSVPHLEAFRSAVRGACFAVQQNLVAAKAYLNAGYSHGCRDPICLRWLAICLLATGETANARPILDEWKQAEPRNAEVDKLLSALASAASSAPPPGRRFDVPADEITGPKPPIMLNVPVWSPTPTQR